MKVGVLFDSLGPYHIARLNAAAKVLNVVAIELAPTSGEYNWMRDGQSARFELHSLFPSRNDVDVALLPEQLNLLLTRCAPNVIAIPGWTGRLAFASVAWGVHNNVPMIVMSESTHWDFPRRWVKEAVKKWYLKFFSAAIVGGQPHQEYIESLGVGPARISHGYDVVDNDYFRDSTQQLKVRGRDVADLPTKRNFFLASARFIPKKNLVVLLHAFSEYRKLHASLDRDSLPWDLIILGDGPLRPSLEVLAQQLGIHQSLFMPGFQQYDSLPKYFAFASAFLHASTTEQWGLVVNEAMASGLPVIVSERCGCARDLVESGSNGFVFPPNDPSKLADLMLLVTSDSVDREAMGRSSLKRISRWSPDTFGCALLNASQSAVKQGCPNLGIFDKLFLSAMCNRGS